MFVLGITGPSGAGKGTASEILKKYGFYHIDTDRLVPEIYPAALPQLIGRFGPQIAENGTVVKKELAKAAFSSPEATAALNGILHPMIMARVEELIREAEAKGYAGVSVDGAALHEAHAERVCDKILCILAPREERLHRVVLRDGIPQNAAKMRFEAQKSDEYYASQSDAVIVNRTVEQLEKELKALLKEWEI